MKPLPQKFAMGSDLLAGAVCCDSLNRQCASKRHAPHLSGMLLRLYCKQWRRQYCLLIWARLRPREYYWRGSRRTCASTALNGMFCVCLVLHTSTFGAHPGSIDVRVRFIWMMWTLSSDLGCAPANRTRVCLKRVVWGMVQVNSGTVRCWCERNRTKSQQWTAINAVLFDKNVFFCVFHSLSFCVTDALQAESCMSHFCSPSAFFRAFLDRRKCHYVLKLCKQNERSNSGLDQLSEPSVKAPLDTLLFCNCYCFLLASNIWFYPGLKL